MNRLVVRSRDRGSSDDHSDFKIELPRPIGGKWRITHVVMPNSFYNIGPNNNKIYFDEDGSTVLTATITSGMYTSGTIAAAVKTAMEAAGAETYTVTLSSTTNKLTIASTGNVGFWWGTYTDNSASEQLGFSDENLLPGSSQTADMPLNLSYPMTICMKINASINYQIASQNSFSGTVYLPLNVDNGSIMYYQPDPKGAPLLDFGDRLHRKLHVQLADDRNRSINPNANWEFLIEEN